MTQNNEALEDPDDKSFYISVDLPTKTERSMQ